MGHALVEYAPGCILAFYPNCSDANGGHTGDGWMEYKRSEDGGRTWSAAATLPFEIIQREYGALAFLPGGGLIAYVYNQTDEKHLDCAISPDEGRTWSAPQTA